MVVPEWQSEGARFLIDAGRALTADLGLDATAQLAASLAVPFLASLCTIDLVEEDGALRRAGAALAEAGGVDPLAALPRPGELLGLAAADPLAPAVAFEAESSDALGRLGCRAGLAVPLLGQGRRLGVMLLAGAEAAGPAERALAEAFGQSVALALVGARRLRIAEQAIRARDEVLAVVVHELRGPVARIALRVDLLHADLLFRPSDRGAGAPASRQSVHLTQIAAVAMKMGRTLDELQDVVTLRPGQRPGLARRPVDLVAVARLAAESHAADAGRAIDFRADRDELVGSWDAARVERVLDNLIGNAVKYSSDQAEISVAVGLERDERGGWATLTVRDRGPGIAPDDLPHVFEWSRRGRDAVGRRPGSGLGLAIVRQVVEQHGGTVAVSSQPGRGSTFVVRLPLEDGPPPAQAALDPSEGSPERSVERLESSGSASAAG